MQEEIKCPQCKGNKFSEIGAQTYKCMYCGNVFSYIKKDTQSTENLNPSVAPSPQKEVTVNVNVNGQKRSTSQNDFAKGAVTAAGATVGGCLTGGLLAIILPIAIPILIIIALLSTCS